MNLNKSILSKLKEDRTFLVLSLPYNNMEGEACPGYITPLYTKTGVLYRHTSFKDEVVSLRLYNKLLKSFTRDLVIVETEGGGDFFNLASKKGLYISFSGNVKSYIDMGDNEFLNIETTKIVSGLPKDSVKYELFIPDKQGNGIFLREGSDIDYLDKQVFNGAIARFKEEGLMTHSKLFKNLMRLDQKKAPSASFGGDTHNCNLVIDFNEAKHKDGNMIVASEFIQSLLSKYDDPEIRGNYDLDSINGQTFQVRPLSAKAAAEAKSRKNMVTRITHKNGGTEWEIVSSSKFATDEVRKNFSEAMKGEGAWAGKVIQFGEGKPSMFMDLCVLKADVDLYGVTFEVLKMTSGANNKVSTSHQCLFDLMRVENGPKTILELRKKQILEGIKDLTRTDKEPIIPKITDLYSKLYVPELMRKILPNECMNDKFMRKVMIKDFLSKEVTHITRGNLIVDGFSAVAIPDPGADYGFPLLEVNECYFVHENSNGIKEVWVIRHPKTSNRDSMVFSRLSYNEVYRRIMNLEVSKAIKTDLIDTFKSLKPGNAIFPTHVDFTTLYGTSDWDYDMFNVIFQKEVVELAKKIKPLVIDVVLPKPEERREVSFCQKDIIKVWKGQLESENLSIGEMANNLHALLTLFDDLSIARDVLAMGFKQGNKKDFYKIPLEKSECGLDKKTVSIDIEKEFLSSLKGLDYKSLSDENILCILEDLVVIHTMYLQRTVDALKTHDKIEPGIILTKTMEARSLKKEDVSLSIDGDKLLFTNKSKDNGITMNDKGKTVYVFNDIFHKMKVELMKLLHKQLKPIMAKEIEVSSEEMVLYSQQNIKDPEMKKSLIEVKKIYNDLVGCRSRRIEKITESLSPNNRRESKILEEVARSSRLDFEVYDRYLSSMIRQIAYKDQSMNPAKLGMWMKNIARREDSPEAIGSKFALTSLPEEYALSSIRIAQLQGKNVIDYAVEKLYNADHLSNGDIVGIAGRVEVNGKSYVNAHVKDGEYIVREINSKKYISKNIEDILDMSYNKGIIFRFHWSTTKEELVQIKKTLEESKNIRLISSVGVGDMVQCKSDCSRSYKVLGKFATAPGNGPINQVYNKAVGSLVDFMVGSEKDREGRDCFFGLVVMDLLRKENSKTVDNAINKIIKEQIAGDTSSLDINSL